MRMTGLRFGQETKRTDTESRRPTTDSLPLHQEETVFLQSAPAASTPAPAPSPRHLETGPLSEPPRPFPSEPKAMAAGEYAKPRRRNPQGLEAGSAAITPSVAFGESEDELRGVTPWTRSMDMPQEEWPQRREPQGGEIRIFPPPILETHLVLLEDDEAAVSECLDFQPNAARISKEEPSSVPAPGQEDSYSENISPSRKAAFRSAMEGDRHPRSNPDEPALFAAGQNHESVKSVYTPVPEKAGTPQRGEPPIFSISIGTIQVTVEEPEPPPVQAAAKAAPIMPYPAAAARPTDRLLRHYIKMR
jgi:hypothetical protein